MRPAMSKRSASNGGERGIGAGGIAARSSCGCPFYAPLRRTHGFSSPISCRHFGDFVLKWRRERDWCRRHRCAIILRMPLLRSASSNPWVLISYLLPPLRRLRLEVAEREGFEPPEPFGSIVFKTTAFGHSAISPILLNFCLEAPFSTARRF